MQSPKGATLCDCTYMKSESESLFPSETSNGGATGGNCGAARRGGEQPEVEPRSQTQVNTIRPDVSASLQCHGEACLEERNLTGSRPSSKIQDKDTWGGWCENVEKVSCGSSETCDLQEPATAVTGVRAAIVALKSVNADGAKGGRKMKASSKGAGEIKSASVLHGDKQAEEDLWQRYKAEHGIWSEKMLKTLEQGIGGNKWFSLIDKVYAERTLGLAWEKVRVNAGACGVDGITVERFAKTAKERLLVVKEQLRNGNYQPKPVKWTRDREPRKGERSRQFWRTSTSMIWIGSCRKAATQ